MTIPPSHIAKPTAVLTFDPETATAIEGAGRGGSVAVCSPKVVSIVVSTTKVDVSTVVRVLCFIKVRVVVLLGMMLVVVEVSVSVVEILLQSYGVSLGKILKETYVGTPRIGCNGDIVADATGEVTVAESGAALGGMSSSACRCERTTVVTGTAVTSAAPYR